MATKKVSVSLSEEIFADLENLSKKLNMSRSSIIKKAICFYLDNIDLQIAEERLKKLNEGKSYTIDADEVFKKAGV